MVFTGVEIFEIIVTIFIVGFIFEKLFQLPAPFKEQSTLKRTLLSSLILSPGIILHELGHKFVALAFGCSATYQMSFFGLLIGVILKLIDFPFFFFIPAYVSISSIPSRIAYFFIAIAGPLVNAGLFLFFWTFLKLRKVRGRRAFYFFIASRMNLYLFILNLLPIPGTDGYQALAAILG